MPASIEASQSALCQAWAEWRWATVVYGDLYDDDPERYLAVLTAAADRLAAAAPDGYDASAAFGHAYVAGQRSDMAKDRGEPLEDADAIDEAYRAVEGPAGDERRELCTESVVDGAPADGSTPDAGLIDYCQALAELEDVTDVIGNSTDGEEIERAVTAARALNETVRVAAPAPITEDVLILLRAFDQVLDAIEETGDVEGSIQAVAPPADDVLDRLSEYDFYVCSGVLDWAEERSGPDS